MGQRAAGREGGREPCRDGRGEDHSTCGSWSYSALTEPYFTAQALPALTTRAHASPQQRVDLDALIAMVGTRGRRFVQTQAPTAPPDSWAPLHTLRPPLTLCRLAEVARQLLREGRRGRCRGQGSPVRVASPHSGHSQPGEG